MAARNTKGGQQAEKWFCFFAFALVYFSSTRYRVMPLSSLG